MNATTEIEQDQPIQASLDEVLSLLISILSDGIDHPEVWGEIPGFLEIWPDMPDLIEHRLQSESDMTAQALLILLKAVAQAEQGHIDTAFAAVEELAIKNSQSALVQGALFRLKAIREPDNPAYDLSGTFCSVPFRQLDVLENSSHQCCASWLNASAGNLQTQPWREVWNSPTAKAIRASIHDGTYRYCNKSTCPEIAGKTLQTKAEAREESPRWAQIIDAEDTDLEEGPETVNLAYDRTCNLACPSCRVSKYAADTKTRERYATMQQDNILPMLKNAKTVFVTGSGDPFASKNFRRLMKDLTEEEYPELGFQIMTNAMLLTPKQWAEFPTLHGRTRLMKVSIDAATGPTHEKLRLGAKWPIMMENMKFAGELAARGEVDCYELVFTVQQDNYLEMADAVDLAKEVGAQSIYFARITNWGTFTPAQFTHKAVFMPSHPEYRAFLKEMQDPRLLDPMVRLGDLGEFVGLNADEGADEKAHGATREKDILHVS
ncbi:MAG: radical SAM protein [Pseudomonadota bacterium]